MEFFGLGPEFSNSGLGLLKWGSGLGLGLWNAKDWIVRARVQVRVFEIGLWNGILRARVFELGLRVRALKWDPLGSGFVLSSVPREHYLFKSTEVTVAKVHLKFCKALLVPLCFDSRFQIKSILRFSEAKWNFRSEGSFLKSCKALRVPLCCENHFQR